MTHTNQPPAKPGRFTQEAHGMHGVLALVAVEAGVSVVPASMATVRAAEVRCVPLDGPLAAFDLVTVRREDGASPAALALFAALLDTR